MKKNTDELPTMQHVLHAQRGDHFFVHNIDGETFHTRAKAFQTVLREFGIEIGCVYHVPIRTGIITVK